MPKLFIPGKALICLLPYSRWLCRVLQRLGKLFCLIKCVIATLEQSYFSLYMHCDKIFATCIKSQLVLCLFLFSMSQIEAGPLSIGLALDGDEQESKWVIHLVLCTQFLGIYDTLPSPWYAI